MSDKKEVHITYIEDERIKPFSIKIDRSNYTVVEKRESESGREYERDFCYPSTLAACLQEIIHLKLALEPTMNLDELQQYIKRIKEIETQDLCKQLLKQGKR